MQRASKDQENKVSTILSQIAHMHNSIQCIEEKSMTFKKISKLNFLQVSKLEDLQTRVFTLLRKWEGHYFILEKMKFKNHLEDTQHRERRDMLNKSKIDGMTTEVMEIRKELEKKIRNESYHLNKISQVFKKSIK